MASELTEKETVFLAELCENIASQDTLATRKPVIWCLLDTRTFRDDGPDADSVEICRITGMTETPTASGWNETAELLNGEILKRYQVDIGETDVRYCSAVPSPADSPDSVMLESNKNAEGYTYKWQIRDTASLKELLEFLNADMEFAVHGIREEQEIVPGIFALTRNGIEECAKEYEKRTRRKPVLYCMNAEYCTEIAKLAVIFEKMGITEEEK